MPRVRPPLTRGTAPPHHRSPATADHLHVVSGVSTCGQQGNGESANRLRLAPAIWHIPYVSRGSPPGVPSLSDRLLQSVRQHGTPAGAFFSVPEKSLESPAPSHSHLLTGTAWRLCAARSPNAATSRHGRHARPLPSRSASAPSRRSSGNAHATSSDSRRMRGSHSSSPFKGAGTQQCVRCGRPSNVASRATGTQASRR